MIEHVVHEMSQLIEALLDVTRLEAGYFRVEPGRERPAHLIYDAVMTAEPQAADKGIEIQVKLDRGLPFVRADATRTRQVLENLLGNALKFTPAGGQVTVRAALEGEGVRFSVSDTGMGIQPEHLPRVFDRYWQARHVRRAGAGLGLAIAKGIVEAHGGRIWAESAVGKGSTFHFTLPAFHAPGPGDDAAASD
jgi:signal transduction histidine kinase